MATLFERYTTQSTARSYLQTLGPPATTSPSEPIAFVSIFDPSHVDVTIEIEIANVVVRVCEVDVPELVAALSVSVIRWRILETVEVVWIDENVGRASVMSANAQGLPEGADTQNQVRGAPPRLPPH
jgi:hypothetical protein